MPKKKANAAPLAAAATPRRGVRTRKRDHRLQIGHGRLERREARGERREAGLLSSSLLIETLPKMQMPAGCPLSLSLSLPPRYQ